MMTSRILLITATAILLAFDHAAAGNKTHELLLKRTAAEQANFLGRAVGEGCQGKDAFFMGMATKGYAKDKAFWSVRCTDGRAFSVMIEPNAAGSSTVLECAVLQSVGGGRCFKKFRQ